MPETNMNPEAHISKLETEIAHWKATAHENAGTVPLDAVTQELQRTRELTLDLLSRLAAIRDVLHDAPGIQVGNSKVHFAFHKAAGAFAA